MISSCILLFYIPALAQTPDTTARDARSVEAERLYADRANLSSARRAAALWADELARNPQAFDAAWKLARADYWLGGHAEAQEQRKDFEGGIDAAKKAIALQPNRPEGHFWMAANMGSLAESFGLRQGIKYRKPIREALETVLKIDPAFQQGSADRALGRWYFKVPGMFGGSDKQAETHLRTSLTYNPNSTVSHFFLAEVLLDNGRKAEGRSELQKVLDVPLDPNWTPEDQEYKAKAKALLAKQ